MLESRIVVECFFLNTILSSVKLLGIGMHAMSGAATGPGPAAGIPGHTAAITSKTWNEGTGEYKSYYFIHRVMVKQWR